MVARLTADAICAALDRASGNVSEAARALGASVTGLRKAITREGIRPSQYRRDAYEVHLSESAAQALLSLAQAAVATTSQVVEQLVLEAHTRAGVRSRR